MKKVPGSAPGVATTGVSATGLTWMKVGASALSLRRPSIVKRYAATLSVFFVIKLDFYYFNM